MDKKLYEMHAEVCRIFTSPKRLEIIDLLRNGEMAVGEMAEVSGYGQANISQHLSILRQYGVVNTRHEGTTVFYSMANPKILDAIDIMREVLIERLKENARITETT